MSPENEQLVRASWARIEPQADRFADAFYARLFEVDPQIRALFAATDMTAHRRKFIDMMQRLVAAVGDPPHFINALAASGRRHAGYGVRDEHYAVVGGALLWALEDFLGPEFSAPTRHAWRELYTLIAAIMRRGADQARAAAPPPAT